MSDIIFGPVNSRRLGRSLGVNLLPHKTCNLDCVYCECGRTTQLTNTRKSFYNADDVLREIDEAVAKAGKLDHITFSGNGEPSLYKDIKKIVRGIKERHPGVKLAVLTNSTLFTDKDVFEAFLEADLVLPSVDSVLEKGFELINKPCAGLNLKDILSSLLEFRRQYKGLLWAEVFICPGINDTDEELKALREYLIKLSPDKVQINSVDRPAPEKWVRPMTDDELKKVLNVFKGLPVEVVKR
ncbi:MAG: radical SAM protein [Pseudomonadota bacterium]